MPQTTPPLCEYVLAAKFDLLKGSTLEYSHPVEVPGYEASYFAETMLPEGAHQWEEDWTMFILNRDGKMELQEASTDVEMQQQKDAAGASSPSASSEESSAALTVIPREPGDVR